MKAVEEVREAEDWKLSGQVIKTIFFFTQDWNKQDTFNSKLADLLPPVGNLIKSSP